MVVRPHNCRVFVFGALRADARAVQIRIKLTDKIFTGLRIDGFVVADAEKNFERAEGSKLTVDKIRPSLCQVIRDGDMRRIELKFGGRDHILIEIVNGAEVAQMPVEVRAALQHGGGDRRHDDVAAIAGIARDREFPGGRGLILGEGGDRNQENENGVGSFSFPEAAERSKFPSVGRLDKHGAKIETAVFGATAGNQYAISRLQRVLVPTEMAQNSGTFQFNRSSARSRLLRMTSKEIWTCGFSHAKRATTPPRMVPCTRS